MIAKIKSKGCFSIFRAKMIGNCWKQVFGIFFSSFDFRVKLSGFKCKKSLLHNQNQFLKKEFKIADVIKRRRRSLVLQFSYITSN